MNERSKKIYAIIIAILLILSIATSFIPSLEVKASQTYYLKDTSLWKYLPTGEELYNLGVYNDGIENSNLGDEILKGCNTTKLLDLEGSNTYVTRYENFRNMLNDTSLSYSGFIGGYSLEQISIDIDSYPSLQWFRDFLDDDSGYNVYLCLNESDTGFQLDYYICADSLENHCFSCNGGGYLYSLSNTTVYMISINLIANNFYNNPNIQVNTVNISQDKISPSGYILYTDFPLYFTWSSGYGNTYQNIDSASSIRTILSQGDTSDFLVDRRTLMSNYGGGLNVDTDPISQDNVGVYDFDFYPSGGVTSGIYVIDNLQLSAKTSEMEDVNLYALISYNFTCNNGYYSTVTAFPIVENYILKNMNTKISQYGIISSNNLETTIPLDDTSYQTFSARSILRDSGPVDEGKRSYYVEDKTRRSISMLHLYGISDALQLISPSQTSPKTIVQSTGAVTNFTVACSIKVDYGDGQTASTLGTIVYDYFTGQSIKSGLTSTDNNTPLDDISSTIQGQLNDINSGGFNGGVGGNTVNGGNNSNVNNPSFVNNNNPTITIENNNGGGWYPSGDDDTQEGGILAQFWAVWSTFEVIQHFTQAVNDNEFLSFIFSSELWQVPGMAIIIPSLVIMILVSILSTIVRFIRGN